MVRSRGEFRRRIWRAALWFFGAFWIAHLVRRWRRADDDPLVLPVLMMLSGIGLMSMIALRDPVRDTLTAIAVRDRRRRPAWCCCWPRREVDFEASPLRRAVLRSARRWRSGWPRCCSCSAAGPGTSGVKVNLFGVQPVEAIRLLVVFALAAYFARRLEFLRELSEPPTPSRPWLRWRARAALEGRAARSWSAWRWCWRSSSCRRISGPRWCCRAW